MSNERTRRGSPAGSPLLASIVLVAGLMACGEAAPTANAPVGPPAAIDTGPSPTGLLAVGYRTWPSPTQIYTIRPDGSGARQLTFGNAIAKQPSWSPDGRLIAFSRLGDETMSGIWVLSPDGSPDPLIAEEGSVERLTSDGSEPFWLDGGRIGFTCETGLCVVNRDGSSRRTLLTLETFPGERDMSYALSPDGTTLAFVRAYSDVERESVRRAIHLVRLDGTGLRRLTTTPYELADEYAPAWSRDGKRIAFHSYLMPHGIGIADATGSSTPSAVAPPQSLTVGESSFRGTGPAWSPDGRFLVFGWNPARFYITTADGKGPVREVSSSLPYSQVDIIVNSWSWTPR